MEQVNINGILWDTENTIIEGKEYFNYEDAMIAAKHLGKRLPTKEEFEALINTGYERDKDNMWFCNKKISFPRRGYFNNLNGKICDETDGFYWMSTQKDKFSIWILYFNSEEVYINHDLKNTNRFSLRCVQDIEPKESVTLIDRKPKQVEINGLLWDTENFEIDGCNKFSYPEAKEYARMKGKRLPTKEEYAALISTGYCINIDKGYEFDSKKLFFPFDGSILYSNREYDIKEDGSKTCLWTQSSCYDEAFLLELNNSTYDEPMLYEDKPLHRLSVRFVQDISRTDYDSLYKISELPTLLDHLTLKEAVELYEKLHERKIEEVKVKMKGLRDYIPREENIQ